jgi:hypothetical protein
MNTEKQRMNHSKKPNFSDGENLSITIPSTWNKTDKKKTNEFSTQTDASSYEFNEIETQTGMGTVLIQGNIQNIQNTSFMH